MKTKQVSIFDINHDIKTAGTEQKEEINKLCATCMNKKECWQTSKVIILRCPNYIKISQQK